MSANPLWLEYRPERFSFSDGSQVIFPSTARMLYNETDHGIFLEHPGPNAAKTLAAAVKNKSELRRIEYSMLVDFTGGGVKRLGFYHPMKSGNGVRVRAERKDFFLFQDSGKPLFSKDWTLRDVSQDSIQSDRPVWQFHGYRHEH